MSSWIEQVPTDQWPDHDDLGPLLPEIIDPATGVADNILAVHSLNPAALTAHLALYRSAMAGTPTLRKVERELIAYVVSAENHCHY